MAILLSLGQSIQLSTLAKAPAELSVQLRLSFQMGNQWWRDKLRVDCVRELQRSLYYWVKPAAGMQKHIHDICRVL